MIKTYEIFTTSFTLLVQAKDVWHALSMVCDFNGLIDGCTVIAVVDKTHAIAKEFGIA